MSAVSATGSPDLSEKETSKRMSFRLEGIQFAISDTEFDLLDIIRQ
jgi:hypothetical protein